MTEPKVLYEFITKKIIPVEFSYLYFFYLTENTV